MNNIKKNKDYVDVAYDERILPFTSYPSKLVNYLVNHYSIKKNQSLLELGCGRGEFLKEFLSLEINSRGLDQSDYARKINPPNTVDVCDIVKEKKLPYSDNTFNFVFSKSFIEHFFEVDFIFNEIHRILKPGGKIITMTPDWTYVFDHFYDDYTHKKPFTLNSLREIHEASSFKNIKVSRFKQLPILWEENIFLKYPLNILSELTRIFSPSYLKKKSKWIRFSKEIMLISEAEK